MILEPEEQCMLYVVTSKEPNDMLDEGKWILSMNTDRAYLNNIKWIIALIFCTELLLFLWSALVN